MDLKRLYVFAAGVFGVVAPGRALRYHSRANHFGFSGLEDVEPKPWMVKLTRAGSVVLVAWALLWPHDRED